MESTVKSKRMAECWAKGWTDGKHCQILKNGPESRLSQIVYKYHLCEFVTLELKSRISNVFAFGNFRVAVSV